MITRYEDLPLGEYMKIDAILRGEGDELEKQVRVIALLSGNTEDEVLALPLDEYASRAAKAAFLAKPYQQSGEVKRTAKEFVIGGMTLIPTTDFTKITTAQYVDFQTFAPVVDDQPAALLSVLMVPKGKGYNEGYDIGEVQRAIREHLTLADAAAVIAFFLLSSRTSIEASLNSLERLARKTKDRTMQDRLTKIRTLFPGSGAGSPASTQ